MSDAPRRVAETLRAAGAEGDAQLLHASCVATTGPGGAPLAALILGRSGSGKSALSLELIARGGVLVSDDVTRVRRDAAGLQADCPRPACAGLIEARGVGILRTPHLAQARIGLIVDMNAVEQDRLPPPRLARLLGLELPRILCGAPAGDPSGAAAAAILILLRAGGAPEPI